MKNRCKNCKNVFVSAYKNCKSLLGILKKVLRKPHKKCPNREFSLVCIFMCSNWIQRIYSEIYSVNLTYSVRKRWKTEQEKRIYLDTFLAVLVSCLFRIFYLSQILLIKKFDQFFFLLKPVSLLSPQINGLVCIWREYRSIISWSVPSQFLYFKNYWSQNL